MLKSIIFGQDAKQALRVQRLLLAASTYFFCSLFAAYSIWSGLLSNVDLRSLLACALLINLVFYCLIRFNVNLRARDPSLTIPQLIAATFFNTYLVYYAGSARGAYIMGYLLILVFAMFRLRPQQVLLIGSLTVAMYGIIIGVEFAAVRDHANLALEFGQWLVLCFVYPWFAWIARHIMSGRRELQESNERLAAALRENEAAFKIIQEQAAHDELTGLFNRRYMVEALRQEHGRAERTREPFCVLIIDIDHFKNINDSIGHLAGDNVLVAVTRTIAAQLRTADRLSRYGGEEFLLLMPSTTLSEARFGAERIRACVEENRVAEADAMIRVTVSIGVAEFRPGMSIDMLLSNADRALYRAKNNGRNRVEYWEDGVPAASVVQYG
ncbi:GGDEF domain-containing protein [Noviherbaspirillum massiliense]|uniref:GGDEF domain-containing protein n=1 Tax=Noviherbaspirillum massiliense TaxID=1465823 RepID=UPI0002F1AEBB|nr:diguanylate cyclase [Noviherbaspirillum massiliense]